MLWNPLQCSEMLLESPPKGCALPCQGLPGVKCHEVGIYLASSGKQREKKKKKGEEKHIPSHPYAQVYATTFSKPGSALNRR